MKRGGVSTVVRGKLGLAVAAKEGFWWVLGLEGTVRVRPRVVASEYWQRRRDEVEMEAAWGRGFGRVMVGLEPGPLDGGESEYERRWGRAYGGRRGKVQSEAK
ncbi:unnamed protein product [Sphenostylis stenocarpa]|uniref:Uncharacterized protein n=1 Tax=Sphenostylis stenocarpa TaxID=92480 RepID=A0AA86SFY5_9FABA|nr:unnamed protein product [Sphenostylis stenocarpa]